MLKTSIIQRRDLDPLWHKATEVVQHYEKASGCIAAVVGADCIAVKHSEHPKAILFCSLCKRYYHSAWKLAPHEVPCSAMHLDGIQKARKLGGSYMYKCPVGFFYCTSPFFAGERFAGAFITSGLPVTEKQPALDRIFDICKGEVSRAEIAQYLDGLPEKTNEEIKAQAQMMLLCAEKISSFDSSAASAENGIKQNHPGYSPDFTDQERRLFASLRRGDNAEAQNIMRKLLNDLNIVCSGNLEYFKLKAVEMVVLLSRTGTDSENDKEAVEANSRYLKRIEDSETIEEVTKNLCLFAERMSGKIFSFQGVRHASALRKAERFIWENYTRKISLKEIAGISGLSAPYFSSVFKEERGENLSNYLNRLRVEKASAMLRETDFSINEISTGCGFGDQSWFSKIFKNYTGISPCKYRKHRGIISQNQVYCLHG